ncbi:MAG TPA: tyrosine-type recombinase/integrase [Acidimicrobiales bacterium]|nr:tyrosine-type recombinase/integrase [Acidimicrobiales bacterium]
MAGEVVDMGFVERRSANTGYRARYRDPLGRQRSRSFARKADAQRFLLEMESDKARGNWIDPRGADVALAEWAEEFLRLGRRLAATTQQTYRRDLDKYVLPRFGAYRIGRIPPDEIENWLNDEIDAGIAPSSVHRHYRTLRRMLQVAVDKQKLLANPCLRVQPPRVPGREMVFLGWEQAAGLANAHSDRYRALIYLAVDSGMRWSELIGLRRARVDLRTRKVRVTEQLIRLDAGEWIRKEPKTPSSVRSITISSFTAGLLAHHLDHFAEPGVDGLVFVNEAGHPLISSSFWNNHFRRALRRAGVSCRFHDLRHSSVALAIAEGAHPKAIQTRMGHSSINVTLDRYGHLFPELDESIATAFGERLAAVQASGLAAGVPAAAGRA